MKGRYKQSPEKEKQRPKIQMQGDTHSAEAPLMGFIQNDDTVLAEEGVCQDLSQKAPISHVPDGSVLKGLIRHSAAGLGFYLKLNTSTQITHLSRAQ